MERLNKLRVKGWVALGLLVMAPIYLTPLVRVHPPSTSRALSLPWNSERK